MSPEQSALIHQFHDYYLLAGTAAATLLGLLFIAVTLNADMILSGARPHVKRLAEQAFQNYVVVLISSLFFLIAGLSARVLTATLLLEGLIMGAWTLSRLAMTLRVADEGFDRVRLWRRMIPSLLGYLMLILGALSLYREPGIEALQYVAFSALLLLI